jgi:hypothetical protein
MYIWIGSSRDRISLFPGGQVILSVSSSALSYSPFVQGCKGKGPSKGKMKRKALSCKLVAPCAAGYIYTNMSM